MVVFRYCGWNEVGRNVKKNEMIWLKIFNIFFVKFYVVENGVKRIDSSFWGWMLIGCCGIICGVVFVFGDFVCFGLLLLVFRKFLCKFLYFVVVGGGLFCVVWVLVIRLGLLLLKNLVIVIWRVC